MNETNGRCIYIDGGTRGNVICLVDRQRDVEIVNYVKKRKTNNELEYLALNLGINYITECTINSEEVKNWTIYSDSMLMVNQLNGSWIVTSDTLKKLYEILMEKLSELKKKIPELKIVWVPRDFNLAGQVLERMKKHLLERENKHRSSKSRRA